MNEEMKPAEASDAAVPKGLQKIIDAVRAEIGEDGTLPAERKLADKLGVKRHQLRSALKVLREAGEVQQPRPAGAAFQRLGPCERPFAQHQSSGGGRAASYDRADTRPSRGPSGDAQHDCRAAEGG